MLVYLLSFVVLCVVAAASPAYQLVDSNSSCSNNDNPLGEVRIRNNLIGDSLTLYFDWASNRSLYLCDENRSLAPHEYQITMRDMTLYVGNTDYSSNRGSNDVVINLGATGQCQTIFNLTLAVEIGLTTSSQTTKNITVSVSQQPIQYLVSNCLVTSDPVMEIPPTRRVIHSPLYWYAQFLKNESLVVKHSNESLCGEPLHTILYRSDTYLSHCATSHDSNEARSAWYRMAIQVVTVVCNDVPQEYKWLWLHAVEILGRHCDLRESELTQEAMIPDSLFMVILNRLHEANRLNVQRDGGENETALCIEIRKHFELTYDDTMSKSLYNQWFYKGFKYMLVESEHMELYAKLIIVAFCLIPFLVIALIGNACYRIKNVVHTHKNV